MKWSVRPAFGRAGTDLGDGNPTIMVRDYKSRPAETRKAKNLRGLEDLKGYKKGAVAVTPPHSPKVRNRTAKNRNGNLSLEETRARGWFVLMDSWKGDAENPFQSRQTTENGFPVFDLLKSRTLL